ncbi:TadE/TadG family type IV pilus assembly protein [Candidatus Oscillochloris fontis]|uniref:TadE/TadG family type IV pilus assembly protein n=1 Tax=Candidatus Oscillochloris fontis TaxID=2496868 RepID=UPI00101B5AA6|nr:TadE/TadG family type IV pilus assembly protein [Candidatus Oscillochloris fontis]
MNYRTFSGYRTLPPRRVSHARRRGQALIEFMLVLPIMLLLLLGLIGVGQILLANYTINQAARVAAHQGALSGGMSNAALSAAEQVIATGVGTETQNAQITVQCSRTPCRRYDPITVQVDYRGVLWVPLPGLLEQFHVQAVATRAAERDSQ